MNILCELTHFQHCAEPQNAQSDIKTLGIAKDGQSYIIVQQSGRFHAFINQCPHLNIPLEWQEHQFLDNDTQLLRCATHGALFMVSNGECVSGPCVGDALTPVDIAIDNNSIILCDSPNLAK